MDKHAQRKWRHVWGTMSGKALLFIAKSCLHLSAGICAPFRAQM